MSYELVVRDLTLVVAGARVDKLAGSTGGLLGRVRHVLTEVAGVGIGQLAESDRVLILLGEVNEGLREGELVGRHITPKENDAAPAGLLGRARAEVLVYRVFCHGMTAFSLND